MGILVPPSVKTSLNFKVVAFDEARRSWRLSWACLYCGSHHAPGEITCTNCGAPRSGPDTQVLADWLAHDTGAEFRP